jgi:hypothetical protein
MCVDKQKKTKKPTCTIVDVVAEIEPATAQIRHKTIRGSKVKRVRRTERGRRGENKAKERVEKKKVHDHILLRLGKGVGLCMWHEGGRRELHAVLVVKPE